ncbi:hypothetical protein EHP00_66 [Ecytonucleospora hepatopenaei]|uniref:CLASP N-terminal domain-containing protein n=1 Tax=Ecytonucleospora hepatopenaei TaxID=646526 RepID=A0A1W0E5N6_9MICR|nr:hypothetical protein EHP00_66 [Ecytonucleospora hepatopenaei]
MHDENFSKILKEVKTLGLVKENEVTWSKINEVILKGNGLIFSLDKEKFVELLDAGLDDLLRKSFVSERSRLNGTCVDLIRNLIKKYNTAIIDVVDVYSYILILIKLTGKSNKIIAQRSETCLCEISKVCDEKKLYKVMLPFFNSNNKKVREALFKAIENVNDKSCFAEIISKGSSDPAWEVRNKAKRILEGKSQEIKEKGIDTVTNETECKMENAEPHKNAKEETKPSKTFNDKKFELSQNTKDLDKFLQKFKQRKEITENNELRKMIDLRKKEAEKFIKNNFNDTSFKCEIDELNESVIDAKTIVQKCKEDLTKKEKDSNDFENFNETKKEELYLEILEQNDLLDSKEKDNNLQPEVDKSKKIRKSIENLKMTDQVHDENFINTQNQVIDVGIKFECASDSTYILETDIKKAKKRNSLVNIVEEGFFEEISNTKDDTDLTN